MNHDQFDLLARRLAIARGRRRFLGAAAAVAVFALTGHRQHAATQEACLQGCAEGDVCTDGVCITPCEIDRDCRNTHDDPCSSAYCLEGMCFTAVIDCLPGYACCAGECCATACEMDDDCAVADPCRWGRCGDDGQCEFTEVDSCHVCSSDEDCQGSEQHMVCCAGSCYRSCPVGTFRGNGCECQANGSGVLEETFVVDDASG